MHENGSLTDDVNYLLLNSIIEFFLSIKHFNKCFGFTIVLIVLDDLVRRVYYRKFLHHNIQILVIALIALQTCEEIRTQGFYTHTLYIKYLLPFY